MWVADLARARLEQQLTALRTHADAVPAGDDPEAIHQMRVATRRLRAALRVFADVLPPEAIELGGELKWLAGALGAVRDLDVQIQRLKEDVDAVQATPEAAGLVVCLFETRRRVADDELTQALASPRYARLLDALEAVLVEPWPATSGEPTPQRLIRARYRRVRRAGARLTEDAAPAELHRARIRTKQLRYTLECFTDLYGGPARKLVRRATRLQDALGTIQDSSVLGEQLREAAQPERDLPASSVFLLGQLAELHAEHVRVGRRQAPAAYRRLRGRPWKRLRRGMRSVSVRIPQTFTQAAASVNTR